MDKKIWYAKHPISRDDVLALNERGYRVVDVAFSPDGNETTDDAAEEKPKPKRKPKA